ncbi:hypothetical protein VHEMI05824 [[Torrubiella] hemipterigena]|uniref:DUF300 domain protein n=1 Tax=[Torrubiella] hemipterigena TaxID=1531966 RepID=A0A0A1THX9_9HYPO|nr:hypothetical protein VHEMI05824 [[Torrubiella] hemipterigena]
MMNLTCNSTLEHLRISPGSEIALVGNLTFHDLARIIGAACTLISVVLSLFLIFMHATHYTKPQEQKFIIRILFMVPIYAISSFLQIQWYWHAIYFQVISDCYEAFAIASFFGLFCHYVAPDLHTQKDFFREMRPISPWVMPVNWFAKCCGGERGPWRTPKSGLTWFNINWIGIYQYCFIRVAMTITAVITQYFKRYCESSNSPVFAHVWISVINALAVTIAMYCLIQFYVQLKTPLKENHLLIKIIAIKLVIFFSFWQTLAISLGTSTLNIVHANETIAYPDLKVGIPALLLCIEMAIFSLLHIWAFPYKPYKPESPRTFYPSPDIANGSPTVENVRLPNAGGFLGFAALFDAMNIWDFVKAFGRGMRWLVCGVRKRKQDISYQHAHEMQRPKPDNDSSYEAMRPSQASAYNNNAAAHQSSPYNNQYGVSSTPTPPPHPSTVGMAVSGDERVGLMANAQPNPEMRQHHHQPSYSAQSYQQQQQQQRPYDPYHPQEEHGVIGQAVPYR